MNYLLVHCNQPVRFQVRIPADLLSKSESVLWPVADQSAASSSARGFTRDNCWPNRRGGAVSQCPPVAAERRDWLTLTGSRSTNQLPRLLIPRGSFLSFPRRAFSFQSLWSCVVEGSERCSSCTLRSGARLNYCPLSLHCARSCWRRPCTGIPACTASVLCCFLNVASTNPFSLFPHFPLLVFFSPFFPPQLHPLFLTFFFLSIFLLFCLFSLFVLPASMASLFIPFLALRIHVYLYLLNIFPIVLIVSFWFSLPLFTFLFLVLFSIFLLCPNSSFYLFHHTLGVFDDACFSSFFTFLFLPFFLSTSPKPFFFFPCLLWSSPRSALLSPSSYCTWCSAIRADSSLSFFSSSLSLLPSPLAPSPQSVHSSLSTRCRLGFRQAGSYQATG